jgi:mycarose O-acyltransferase
MRFIAAAMVFFFHSVYENVFADPVAQNTYTKIFGQGGWAGVAFFFVLSGFVLTWSARATDSVRAFYRRRIFKIFPNHVVTFVVAGVLLISVGSAIGVGPAVVNLFLLQAWFPQLSIEVSMNPVAWSLSCEALFYLCFPFLLRPISRIRPRHLWWWIAGLFVVILVMPIVGTALMPDAPVQPWAHASEWEFWIIYVLPLTRMLDFVIGMLLARVVITGVRVPLSLGQATVVAVAAYTAAWFIPWTYTLVAIWVLPLGLVIAAGAASDVRGRRSWLNIGAMVWLGEVSFAFYMWHRLVLTYGHQVLGGPSRNWSTPVAIGVIALFLGVNLTLSWWLYSLVERPIMRRWSVSRRAKPARQAKTARLSTPEAPTSPTTPMSSPLLPLAVPVQPVGLDGDRASPDSRPMPPSA